MKPALKPVNWKGLANQKKNLALLALPLAYLALALYLRPTGASLPKVSYISLPYLLNGLLAGAGEKIRFTDHPGTPMILLLGALIRVKYFFVGQGRPVTLPNLIEFRERFLDLFSLFIPLANALCFFLFGLLARKKFALPHVLVAQALCLLSPAVVILSTHVRPESFHVAIASLNSLFLLELLPKFLLPLFLGTLISLKLFYLPFLPALLLIRKPKVAALALLATLGLAALYFQFLHDPCITCLGERYSQMLWDTLFRHPPRPEYAVLPKNAETRITAGELFANSLAIYTTLALVLTGIIFSWKKNPKEPWLSPLRLALLIFAASTGAALLHPINFYYFFPALELMQAIYLLLAERFQQRAVLAWCVSGLLLLNSLFLYASFTKAKAENLQAAREQAQQDSVRSRYPHCLFFYSGQPRWEPAHLNRAFQSAGHSELRKSFQAVYPRDFVYLKEEGEFFDLEDRPGGQAAMKRALAAGECVAVIVSFEDAQDGFKNPLEGRPHLIQETGVAYQLFISPAHQK